jgi:AsmA protein
MKRILIIVGIIFVVLILIVVAIPFFVNPNQFKPTLETDLTAALGRQVQIGDINLSIFSGSVSVADVSIADDPAFSKGPFLTAHQLSAGVALMPLIFSKQLQVSSFTIDQPQVSLVRSAAGTWNFSTLGGNAAKSQTPASGSSSGSPASISVAKLILSNGKMTVTEPGGKVRNYDGVNAEADNLSYTSQFPFKFSANTPGQGTIKLSGQAGPVNAADASATPLQATINVSHFDLSSTGFVDPSSGLGGLVDFDGQLASDGKQITSKGTVKGQSLKLVAGSSPSTVPINIDYDAAYDPSKQTGVLNTGNVHIGQALAKLTGTFDTAGAATSVNMKLAGQGMSVPDLEGVLPAVGVKLPSGASLQSGTMDTNLAINGPVDKLVIAGPVTLSNAKVAGFSLKGALGALSSFTGMGGGAGGSDTEIQTFHADVRVDPQGQHAQNITLAVPSIGTVTGAGDASAAGDLNCKMVAALSGAGGALTSVLGGGKNGVPFTVKGTTEHPVFVPDMSAMAQGLLGGVGGGGKTGVADASGAAGAAASALGGLFGSKKKN